MIAENYIGCDVSKDTLDLFDERSRRHCRIANEEAAKSSLSPESSSSASTQ